MVSPFSSRQGLKDKKYMSLFAVVDMIREGRACLATNLATYMAFMVYCSVFTSAKTLMLVMGDFQMSEWHFLTTDILMGIVMVTFMTWSRPAEVLASYTPTSSLLGPRTVLSVVGGLVIFWIALSTSMYMLFLGPGKEFMEFVEIKWLPIAGPEWTKKGDNHIVPVVWLNIVASATTACFVFSYGHVHRLSVLRNQALGLMYLFFIAFVMFLVWSPPNGMNCIFRVNCDNAVSLSSQVPGFTQFSTGAVGGCFVGPQLVSCQPENETNLCWVWGPEDSNFYPTRHTQGEDCYLDANGVDCTGDGEPLFHTAAEKATYCDNANHTASAPCWTPTVADECKAPFGVELPTHGTGCQGPNNCFTYNFKVIFAAIVVFQVVLSHAAYQFLILGKFTETLGAPTFAEQLRKSEEYGLPLEALQLDKDSASVRSMEVG